MASINGISVKNVEKFLGHEGEPLYQGNLYLNGKKIGFWSQDSHGGPDNFMLDGGWKQEKALDDAVKAMNPEKAIHGERGDGENYVIGYGLEFLMTDILDLMNDEKLFKKAVKAGYAGILVATDGYHETVWQLPATYTALSDEALMAKMDSALNKAKESFFPEDKFTEHKVKVYRSLDDFVVGEPIDLSGKSVDKLLSDASDKVREQGKSGGMDSAGKVDLDLS